MARRLLLAIICAVLLLPLAGGIALAHATYVKSNPAADARLAKSPGEIRITFSETPDAKSADIAVLDTSGGRHDKADVTTASDEPNTLRVSVPDLPEGGYLVSWSVTSAVDGHETKGAFAFAIGNAPLPAIPDVGPSSPPPGPLELAGRALSFAGIAVILGAAFFVLFIRPGETADERRRERALITAGAIALVAGSALLLAAYGTGVPQRLLTFLGLRFLAALVALAAVWVPFDIPIDVRRETVAFAGLAGGLWATLVSHATASGDVRYVALDFIHVVAISIWSGGVLALLTVAIPTTIDMRALGSAVWRFSLTALVCVAVIVTTGTLQAFDHLVLVEDLYETPYGLALLAKIVLLVVLVALGAMNLLVWGPRLREGIAARGALVRSVMAESGVFGAVLVATAFLTALAPPAQASGAAFDQTQRVDGYRIELLMPTTTPGRNRFVVRVTQGLSPVTNAEAVTLRFTMVEHDMGIQELTTTQRSPGEYVAEGSPTAMFGTWKIQTILRIPGRLDVSALFTVPIATTSGQAAQVINATPYTVIAFADPAAPQAGAPITIVIVCVDAKGDPVQGQKIQATFSGPATHAPIEAKESTEGGAGRYAVDVPGLEAGSWKITLSVSGAGSGVYTLEVAR